MQKNIKDLTKEYELKMIKLKCFLVKNKKNYTTLNNINDLTNELKSFSNELITYLVDINEHQQLINNLSGKNKYKEFDIEKICNEVLYPFLDKLNNLYFKENQSYLPMPIILKNDIKLDLNYFYYIYL